MLRMCVAQQQCFGLSDERLEGIIELILRGAKEPWRRTGIGEHYIGSENEVCASIRDKRDFGMSDFDSEYFFIRKPKKSPKIPFLIPDESTVARRFRFEAQPIGSAPLVFHNADKDENMRTEIVAETPDVLFSGSSLLVRTPIRDKLLLLDVPNLFMHPAIYIDDKDNWHEDYWFLTFTEDFDCWDREDSEYDDEAIEVGGTELYQVYSYRMNSSLLAKTPLHERLLFKMGGDVHGFICCHQTLRLIFGAGGKSGARLERIIDQ